MSTVKASGNTGNIINYEEEIKNVRLRMIFLVKMGY